MYSRQQLHNFRRHFFKETNKRPFIRLTKGEEVEEFYTIHDCAKFLCLDSESVWNAFCEKTLLKGYIVSNIGYRDKTAINYKLSRFINRPLKENESELTARPVKIIDIIDNVTTSFSSISQAAKHLHVTSVNIRHRITTKEKHSLVANRYIVLDADTPIDFITDEVKSRLLSRVRRQVVEYNQKEGTLTRYIGLADFVRKQRCEENVTHIYYMLKTHHIYLLYPGIYIMFDPKRGRQTPDKEMFKQFRIKINRIRQMF